MLYQTSAQLVMLYYMVSKKHLPGRIVPLRVPFPGYACPNVHVRTAKRDAGYKHLGACIKITIFRALHPTHVLFFHMYLFRHYMHRYDLSFGQAGLPGSCIYALRSR